jgi:hypothetical protein
MDSDGLAGWPMPAEFFAKLATLPNVEGLDVAEQQLLALSLFRTSIQRAVEVLPSKQRAGIAEVYQRQADWRSAATAILPTLQRFVRERISELLDSGRTEFDLHARVFLKVEGDLVRQDFASQWPWALGDPERWSDFALKLFADTIDSERPLVYRRCAECHGIMHTGADARRRFCGEACALKHRRAVSAKINRNRRRELKEKADAKKAKKAAKPRR